MVHDDDVADDGAYFIVMELLAGIGIEELRRQRFGRLPIPWAVNVVDQLLDVLAVAHARGILHRDIKPSNLFLKDDGALKVLDFGIARVRDAAVAFPDQRVTGSGQLGTPGFMAPEQALGRSNEIDERTDVWAASATLFTLISGNLVHAGRTHEELWVCSARDEPRRLETLAPEVPGDIARIVHRGLAFDRSDRWPTAREMLDALRVAGKTCLGGAPERVPRCQWAVLDRLPTEAGIPPTVRVGPTASPPPAPPPTVSPDEKEPPRKSFHAQVLVVGLLGVVALGGVSWLRGWDWGKNELPAPVAAIVDPEPQPISIDAGPASGEGRAQPAPRRPPTGSSRPREVPPTVQKAHFLPPTAPIIIEAGLDPAPVASPPLKPNCVPPFVIDDAGLRIPKDECAPQ